MAESVIGSFAGEVAERIRAANRAPSTDFDMPEQMATFLQGMTVLPRDLRAQAMRGAGAVLGVERMAGLFAEFIGLANSVVDNNRQMIELFLVTDADMHPHMAEKINLPTIYGGLEGLKLAQGVDPATLCHGCAFRLGTPANQSPGTTLDADVCSDAGEEPFYCHADMDDKGNPTHACPGWAQKRRARKSETPA